jgi:uncharacterized protein (DUF697 family)
VPTEVTNMSENDVAAQGIVEKYMWWAVGAGLIPVPILDLAAVTAIDLKMIQELSVEYGVEFREDRGKAIVAALVGGVASGWVGRGVGVITVLKAIPLVGQSVASLSMSIFGGASTYAIGKVFVQHYATGGTMLDFDAEKARRFFGEQFQKGKNLVMRKKTPDPAPAPTPA